MEQDIYDNISQTVQQLLLPVLHYENSRCWLTTVIAFGVAVTNIHFSLVLIRGMCSCVDSMDTRGAEIFVRLFSGADAISQILFYAVYICHLLFLILSN